MDAIEKDIQTKFLNRIDEIIVFQQLTREEIRRIVDIMSARFAGKNQQQGNGNGDHRRMQDMLAKDGYTRLMSGASRCVVRFSVYWKTRLPSKFCRHLQRGDTIEATLEARRLSSKRG